MPAVATTFKTPLTVKDAALPWLKDAEALEKGKTPDWMKALRATGAEVFAATGMPTPAREGWQYTNLRALEADQFRYSADSVKIDVKKLPAPLLADSHRIVLINGQYRRDLSDLPAHAEVLPLAEAGDAQELLVTVGGLDQYPLLALNTAYVRDGFVLKVAKHKDVEKPIEVLFYTTGDGIAAYPRVLYWLQENSGATILERHVGEGSHLANLYAALEVGESARLRYYRFVDGDGEGTRHFSHTLVRQSKAATFEGFSAVSGTVAARQEVRMQLIDAAISGSIGGIYMLKGQESHDFTILADHFEPGGTSIQHFKGVIDDKARAVFQGKIHVHRPAQKTDGYQSHHALLLSPHAEANAKPELEIYADDVKCSHGATAGNLDPEALFYLQSRGIPFDDARNLLIQSFLLGAIERLTFAPAQDLYRDRIEAWLGARQA